MWIFALFYRGRYRRSENFEMEVTERSALWMKLETEAPPSTRFTRSAPGLDLSRAYRLRMSSFMLGHPFSSFHS
jgi:hypothetical protein